MVEIAVRLNEMEEVDAEDVGQALRRAVGLEVSAEAPITIVTARAGDMGSIQLPDCKTIAYLTHSTQKLSQEAIRGILRADLVVATSRFAAQRLSRALSIRVEVCNPGVDVNAFDFKERLWGSPFLFLWEGDSEAERSGFPVMLSAWKRSFLGRTDALLVVRDRGKGYFSSDNIIYDGRDSLSHRELYSAAHCLIVTDYDLGTGVKLLEAMSAGLPVLYTAWGGVLDYVTKGERLLPYKLSYETVTYSDGNEEERVGARVREHDLVDKMQYVWRNYAATRRVARLARSHVEDRFTWVDAGRKLRKLVNELRK